MGGPSGEARGEPRSADVSVVSHAVEPVGERDAAALRGEPVGRADPRPGPRAVPAVGARVPVAGGLLGGPGAPDELGGAPGDEASHGGRDDDGGAEAGGRGESTRKRGGAQGAGGRQVRGACLRAGGSAVQQGDRAGAGGGDVLGEQSRVLVHAAALPGVHRRLRARARPGRGALEGGAAQGARAGGAVEVRLRGRGAERRCRGGAERAREASAGR
mmetsp:Transcript_22945/g.71980  ORF Transcript_22945/g.71980 Transcript_22945/m.71980 type:complete len:216 (-) Transcript_22945:1379-2026(-)